MAKRTFSEAERLNILADYHKKSEPMLKLCERFDVSPSTIYYWIDRDKKHGDGKNSEPVSVGRIPIK